LLLIVICTTLFFMFTRKQLIESHQEITLVNGNKIKFGNLYEKQAIVVFWATTCSTCMQDLPKLAEIKKKNTSFEVIAIAMQYDEIGQVKKYIESQNFDFNFVYDKTGSLAKQFGDVKFTPTEFIINNKGEIIKKKIGVIESI